MRSGKLLDLVERHACGREGIDADAAHASVVHLAELGVAEAVIDDGNHAGAPLPAAAAMSSVQELSLP